MRASRGKSFDDILREELARDPAFAEAYEETLAEGQLASELARYRNEQGMTQAQLAQASGIAQPMISKLERAAQTPSVTTLQKLLGALGAVAEIGADGVHIRSVRREQTSPPVPTSPENTFLTTRDMYSQLVRDIFSDYLGKVGVIEYKTQSWTPWAKSHVDAFDRLFITFHAVKTSPSRSLETSETNVSPSSTVEAHVGDALSSTATLESGKRQREPELIA